MIQKLMHQLQVVVAGTLGASKVFAADKGMHHHHHGENPHAKVVETALDCINKEQACMDHCFELFETGYDGC